MNVIMPSLVESYMYVDMFNREYEGGSDLLQRVHVGGAPVNYLLPHLDEKLEVYSEKVYGSGPLKDKVVPAGLVVAHIPKKRDIEYNTDCFQPGVNREVISDSLYDMLFETVLEPNRKKNRKRTPPKHLTSKERTRKQKK